MPARCPPRPLTDRNAEFVRQFTAKQRQAHEDRIAKQAEALTAGQRAALRKQLEVTQFLPPAYADATKINIASLLRKWKRYCTFNGFRHWRDVIQDADQNPNRDVHRAMAMDFLDYLCQTYRIKSWGTSWQYFRQYKIKSWGTSWQYFRQYKQLYACVTGRYMDVNDSKEIKKWHDVILVAKYKLRPPCILGKDVANVDTLLVLLTFNIRYDTGVFPWEGHRIQLPGCYLGLAFTGARPAEFVDGETKTGKDEYTKELLSQIAAASIPSDEDEAPDEDSRLLEKMILQECEGRGRPKALCYEDILLMVVRHPETGEDVLAMYIRLAHHKGMDNKPKPTIFYFTPTRRLIFCLISVIVSLAVHDGAFAVSKFTSVREVFQARNQGPVKCTPLRWKDEWLKRPVFRQYDESTAEKESDERKYEPLPYHKLHYDMERQSLDAGEENKIEPKAWRRGAANAANGKASDAVRDQMMRHDPQWATFNSAYINEKVGFHLQNAFLDEPTEDSLLAMLSHIGLMRDPRASKDMVPDEVWELMPPDPETEALKEERARLKGGRYRIKGSEHEGKIRELTKLIATKEQQRKTAIRRDYRKHYFHNRPTWDMESDGQEEEEYVEPAIDLQIPERAQLAEILCNQPDNLSPAELLELRIQAAELMVILCSKRKTARPDRIRRRARAQAQADVTVKQESPGPDPFPLVMDREQCPRCIGDERLSHEERTFKYCRPAVMYDHFDRKHAEQLRGVKRISCNHPKCKEEALEFKHLNHFKNHVERVHGVKLRA